MDGSEKSYIGWILNQNQDKDFVQRILKPQESPYLDLGDGDIATHMMEYEKHGNGWVVYPRVMRDGQGLKDYGDNAMMKAINDGDYIEFKSPGEAEWFSKNYKKFWELD
jgi:hypothetical protein